MSARGGVAVVGLGLTFGVCAVPAGALSTVQDGVPTAAQGEVLARTLGCGGCHAGVPSPEPGLAPALGPGAPPAPVTFVFEYLADPVPRRPEIAPARMPDFGLGEEERLALAMYLGSGDGGGVAEMAARYPDATRANGRRLYARLGCQACHATPGLAAATPAPDLSGEGARVRADWLRQWLRAPVPVRPAGDPPGSGRGMPDFRLTDAEAEALTLYLSGLGARGSPGAGSPSEGWTPEPLSDARIARAERLLESRFACLGCHQLAGTGGRIGPALDGVAARLRASYVRGVIADPAAVAPGSHMPRQRMRPADVELLASYLLGVEDVRSGSAEPTGPHPVADDPPEGSSEGVRLYATHCASCHGTGGGGDGWNAANLPVPPTAHADSSAMSARADDTLFDGIHGGGWVLDKSPRMPAFGDRLSGREIRLLVDHIRVLCRCQEPVWAGPGDGEGEGASSRTGRWDRE